MEEIQAIDELMLRHNKIQTKIPGNLSTCVPLLCVVKQLVNTFLLAKKNYFDHFSIMHIYDTFSIVDPRNSFFFREVQCK